MMTLITGFTCPPTIYFKFITKCDKCYYKVRQFFLLQSAMVCYYKVRQLFNYKVRQVNYKVRQVLQSVTIYYKVRQILQSATIITKCDSTHHEKIWVKTSFWSLCYRRLCDGFNVHFMQKHRKWTARLPLSAGCLLIAQAGFFICCTTTVGLYLGWIILPKFHVPSRDFLLQSFAKFHCLWKCWR